MTASATLSTGSLQLTRGPTPVLPRKAAVTTISTPSWLLLQDVGGQKRLVDRVCEALLVDPLEASWIAGLEPADQPPSVFLANLLARIAVHLQNVAGHPVSRSAVMPEPDTGSCAAAWEYLWPKTGEAAGQAAADLLTAAAGPDGQANQPVPLEKTQDLVSFVTSAFGNSVVEVILAEAHRRGIPFHFVDPIFPMIAFGQGSASRRLMTSMSHAQGHISTLLTRDKMLALWILREAGFPVPSHKLVSSADAAASAAERLGYPVVVKPVDLMRSQGVSVNLATPEAVRRAFDEASALSHNIMVETHLPGLPYRILVIDGQARAAMRRSVPMVVGDGSSDITKLIETTNLRRARMALKSAAAPRRIDVEKFEDELGACLSAQGLSMASIPPAGAEIQLAFMARTGRGGENLDVTAQVHPDNLAMAEEAARILEVGVFGLDFMTDDISRSYKEGNCGINEVNNEPALSLHLAATQSPRDVVTPFFDMEFGRGGNGCIPVICCLGDADGGRFAILESALEAAGQQPGLAAGDDLARTGRFRLPQTDDFSRPAERILADPRVDCALISLAQEDFGRGLAFDRCSAFFLPPAPADNMGADVVEIARLMATEITTTVILNERDSDFWYQNLDFSGSRIILLSGEEDVAKRSVQGELGDGFERLSLTTGRTLDVYYHHGEHVDRLITLDPERLELAEQRDQLLFALAALLSLKWHSREIWKVVNKICSPQNLRTPETRA